MGGVLPLCGLPSACPGVPAALGPLGSRPCSLFSVGPGPTFQRPAVTRSSLSNHLAQGLLNRWGLGNAGLWRLTWKQPHIVEFPVAASRPGTMWGSPGRPMGAQHMPCLRELPWGWGGFWAGDPHMALSFPGTEVWLPQLGPTSASRPPRRSATNPFNPHSLNHQPRKVSWQQTKPTAAY